MFFRSMFRGTARVAAPEPTPDKVANLEPEAVGAPPVTDELARDATPKAPDAGLAESATGAAPPAGSTVAQTPEALAAKLESEERDRVDKLCQAFVADRHSLDDDPSIEWVEGWHGIRAGNEAGAVPGIVDDQGLFVSKSVSYMPTAAYWHGKRPSTPQHWMNHSVEVHFRVPQVYLQSQGKFTDDPSAGQRFSHESSVSSPHSKSNSNIEIMPVQVLEVYWVKGAIPGSCKGIGVDLTNATEWPD